MACPAHICVACCRSLHVAVVCISCCVAPIYGNTQWRNHISARQIGEYVIATRGVGCYACRIRSRVCSISIRSKRMTRTVYVRVSRRRPLHVAVVCIARCVVPIYGNTQWRNRIFTRQIGIVLVEYQFQFVYR